VRGRKEKWERVAEPSEGLVHFCTTGTVDLATLCGISDWLGRDRIRAGDGVYTDDAVNCKGCLAIAKYVVERGLPEELTRPWS
jgi:hypothetical protein